MTFLKLLLITLGLIVLFLGGLGFLALAREMSGDYRNKFFRDPGYTMFRHLLTTPVPGAAGLWLLGWALIIVSVIGEGATLIIGLRDLFLWSRGISYAGTTTGLLCAELAALGWAQLQFCRLGVLLTG
jgi:hypothetical protein